MSKRSGFFQNHLRDYNKTVMLVGGGLLVCIALVIRMLSESPVLFWHAFSNICRLPPLWLMSLFWLVFCFILGCAGGGVMSMCLRSTLRDVWRYRGGMYFILSIVLMFMWYLLIFGMMSLLFSFVLLISAIALTVLTAIFWIKVNVISGVAMFIHSVWLIFIAMVQLSLIFS